MFFFSGSFTFFFSTRCAALCVLSISEPSTRQTDLISRRAHTQRERIKKNSARNGNRIELICFLSSLVSQKKNRLSTPSTRLYFSQFSISSSHSCYRQKCWRSAVMESRCREREICINCQYALARFEFVSDVSYLVFPVFLHMCTLAARRRQLKRDRVLLQTRKKWN